MLGTFDRFRSERVSDARSDRFAKFDERVRRYGREDDRFRMQHHRPAVGSMRNRSASSSAALSEGWSWPAIGR
jgi:hypothetical protein